MWRGWKRSGLLRREASARFEALPSSASRRLDSVLLVLRTVDARPPPATALHPRASSASGARMTFHRRKHRLRYGLLGLGPFGLFLEVGFG